ncbi:MAG: dTDP-Rha:a-D-GlcNAc-diphosphoryl polyprenol, a-3-L-rhamnosyl transferase [Deltaproteobacteria bacterium]|nr:dTDP-Rha:a-D-GlcNAc-diphosphoryl polyprenol, a-3-L-rhamnosyl transferase [Deltaproteobacteria bacterium]
MAHADNPGPVISLVTVTFNSEDHIRGCLNSVGRSAEGLRIEHIVIDNASKDGTATVVRGEFPEVVFIQNALNRGLTAANNQGAQVARGRYVVFLNPDTIVPEGTFQTMVDIMERHPDIGVLAPRLVDEHGHFTPGIMGHRAPSAWTLINSFLLISRLSHDLFPGIHRTKDINGLEDCDWACGACLMVRREVADAFAWRQFGSGDDFDYCIQIREAGWRVALTGDAQVVHFIGRSFTLVKPITWVGTASNFARYLHEHRGPLHTVIGIAGMRFGLRLRGAVHYLLYLFTRDPERLHKVNKTQHFLAHDDYSVFRKLQPPTPTSYPN